ncbi:Frag1/DRAM/Sfk1 family-domain-containing protein [Aspergillus lucknowensis]|uniref:Frag1/DRAM/Sfk1 family-domain-containing protein n=1 Tax=Aspergillus lucknowensis TaxID=176173 RepID=A0ABR4LG92_9EURO
MLNHLLRCHDHIWAALHFTILNIPPYRLYLFPSLAGSVWFLTLTSLLLTWIGRGMRPYPGQSNPHVPFISDIASFELKPLFLVGASITAMGFFFTVAAVHVMRYEPGFALIRAQENHHHCTSISNDENDYEEEEEATLKSLKIISLLSIFAAGLASTALVLLAVMDTFRYKSAHHVFLRLCFAGLAVQSAGTAIVYADEVLQVVSYLSHFGRGRNWGRSVRRGLRVRIFATLSTSLILVELFLAVAFLSLTVDEENADYRSAGILEWIIAFLGTAYLWMFCGFFDRRTFDGYEPSIIYQSTTGSTGMLTPRTGATDFGSSGVHGHGRADEDVDTERAPLLGERVHTDRKYT